MKFSPDGKTLAVGSHDDSIYLYAVSYTKTSGALQVSQYIAPMRARTTCTCVHTSHVRLIDAYAAHVRMHEAQECDMSCMHGNGCMYANVMIASFEYAGVTSAVSCTKKAKFSKHHSYITHLDFTADGQKMRSNCGAYELLFSDANSGMYIQNWSSTQSCGMPIVPLCSFSIIPGSQ